MPLLPRHSLQRLCSTSAAAGTSSSDYFSGATARAAASILGAPDYESRLLSLLPRDLLFHPTSVRLTLSHLLPSAGPSLRFLFFLSSHLPSPDAAPVASPPPCGIDAFLVGLTATQAADVAELLASHLGIHPSLRAFNFALRNALRAPARPDLVFRLFSAFSSSPDFPGDADTVACLARACAADGRPLDGFHLLRDAARRGVPPSADAVADLVKVFATAGNFGKVSDLLHLMIAAGGLPDTVIYQCIMRGLFLHGMGIEALRVFNEIKLRGYDIDVVTYTTVIRGLCEMGCIDEARQTWNEMVDKGIEPSEHSYCSLIRYYCGAGDFGMAFKVYDEMLGKGFKESNISCNTLLTGFCIHGRMEEAFGIFNQMVRKGIERDVVTYNILIQGLCKAGRSSEAMQVYEQLVSSSGLEPSVATFTPLIDAMCDQGQVDAAVELLKGMHANGLEPLVRSNDRIIQGFCKAGRPEDGMAWLAGMLENNLEPSEQTFISLVKLLSSSGRVDDALLVLGIMFKIGYKLESSACTILVQKLCPGTVRGGEKNRDRRPKPKRPGPKLERQRPKPERLGPKPKRSGPKQERLGPKPERLRPKPKRPGPKPKRPNSKNSASNLFAIRSLF